MLFALRSNWSIFLAWIVPVAPPIASARRKLRCYTEDRPLRAYRLLLIPTKLENKDSTTTYEKSVLPIFSAMIAAPAEHCSRCRKVRLMSLKSARGIACLTITSLAAR